MPCIARVDTFAVAYQFEGAFKFFAPTPPLPAGRRTVVVKLTTDDGTTGWGQAVPSPRWSYETPETVRTTIDLYLKPLILNTDPFEASELWRRMNAAIAPSFSTGQPIAKAAVDLALWDLQGKLSGKTIGDLWGRGAASASVTLSWTLNPRSLEELETEVAAGIARGYRHFNLKVAPDVEFDECACRRLRELVPDGFLWADANGGYDFESARRAARCFAELGFAALEQPLRANSLEGYRRLREQRVLPILMDESIVSVDDFDEFHRLGLLDGVAMKVARMGGLTEACRLVDRLRETGALFFASGLTDPDLSLAASLHLFSAGGLAHPAALNGPQFLRGSILCAPMTPIADRITPPTGVGLGVDVDEARLGEYLERADRE